MAETKWEPETATRSVTRDARLVGRIVPWILGLGVVTRAVSYLENRSLWLDESMIALNIESRSFLDLAGTLDFSQAAPLGFLWLEKLAVTVLGVSELALRLWPYLAGVVSLFLIDRFASRFMRPGGRLFTVGLAAISGSLVYYSSEVKQYSFDVVFAAVFLLVGAAMGARLSEEADRLPWRAFAFAGALGVWFSHPVVFVLPGVLLYLWMAPGSRGPRLRPLLLTALLWGASFVVAFYLTARGASQNPVMARFWVEGFMPLPPTSASDFLWFVDAASGWIRNTLDFAETQSPLHTIGIWCGLALAVAGIGRGWTWNRRALALVALPVLLALLASALRLYPFKGRLGLFLVPSTLILMGWGVDSGVSWLRRRDLAGQASGVAAGVRAVFLALAFAVLVSAASITTDWSRAPYREELRPVLLQVAERVQPGDLAYLHSGAQHAALFYERACEACGLEPAELARGGFPLDGDEAVRDELGRLPAAPRIWAIFAHEWWGYGDIERDQIVAQLTSLRGVPDTVSAPGAEAYLFEGIIAGDPRVLSLGDLGLRGELAAATSLSDELAREAWAEGRVADAHWFALQPAYLILYGLRDSQRALDVAETLFDGMPFERSTAESGLVLADFFARAGQPDRARAFAESWLRTRAIERPHAEHERVEALLSIATGNPASAVARLQSLASRNDGCAACVAFDLAVALEAMGEAGPAIESFERFLKIPQSARSTESFARPYAIGRLARLYASRARDEEVADSDRADALARAEELDGQLDALWSGGDPEFRAGPSN